MVKSQNPIKEEMQLVKKDNAVWYHLSMFQICKINYVFYGCMHLSNSIKIHFEIISKFRVVVDSGERGRQIYRENFN